MRVMNDYNERLEAAKKRVKDIKGFYAHLRAYILVNILILLLRMGIVDMITMRNPDMDPSFFDWLDLNVLITPLLWGIGLLIHGIFVFRYRFPFLKNWEERQIKKIMEEEEARENKFK